MELFLEEQVVEKLLVILPNIEDRIKSDYGLLIYDFKGNLHLQTKYLAQNIINYQM